MGIDIYYVKPNTLINENDYLWTMEDEDIAILSPIFLKFENKTGYILDEYGDLILPVEALKNLLLLIEKSDQSESLSKLRGIVKGSIKQNKKLGFYGD